MDEQTSLISSILTSGLFFSILTLVLSKLLGKKKEDIEIALKYQEYYKKHIKSLEEKIEKLSIKVEELIKADRENIVNLRRWENNVDELKTTIKLKDQRLSDVINELEEKDKKIYALSVEKKYLENKIKK
jgi:peptidoglycan hydrolase CwlO-like protein